MKTKFSETLLSGAQAFGQSTVKKKFARVISKQKQKQNKKKINKNKQKNKEMKPKKKTKTTLALVSLVSVPQFTVSWMADAIFATLSLTINEFSIPN